MKGLLAILIAATGAGALGTVAQSAARHVPHTALLSTHNEPDGRCHEDMVCWYCKPSAVAVCAKGANDPRN